MTVSSAIKERNVSSAQKPVSSRRSSKQVVNPKLYGAPTVPLDPSITLNDVIKSLPKDVFVKDMRKAWQQVIITYSAVALSMYLIHVVPWYLLPLAWIFSGTAATGLFVIGHECGHMSFAKQRWLNDLVGIVSYVPSLYPFESWRIQHNHHHAHTNKLHVDNAWQPFQTDYWQSVSAPERFIMRHIKTSIYFMASIGHQIKEHFFLSNFTEEQRPRVMFSLACVYAYAAVFFPTMYYYTGAWGIFKFWVMPFVGYHFWMSTFTLIHHTLPHLPFLEPAEWNDAQARLTLTVHCEFPAWIELLCHHINVHVPHHVSTSIPAYNLRRAHQALLARWGPHMTCIDFSWDLLRDITATCHLYDKEECYVPFSTLEEPSKAASSAAASGGSGSARPPSPKLD